MIVNQKNSDININHGYKLIKGDKELQKKNYQQLKKPLVVKPIIGTQGDCVFCNIQTEEKYNQAVATIEKFSKYGENDVLVEEMFVGKEYRILATKNKN